MNLISVKASKMEEFEICFEEDEVDITIMEDEY